MSNQTYTVSGTAEQWTITTPDGITITPAGDAAGTLNVNIDYTDASLLDNTHGILSVDFQPVIDKIASFGFHAPINLTITNGMSVPIAGFDLMTYNDNMANPTPVAQPGHPTNYAHFHGPGDTDVPLTIFAPETITTEAPNGSSGDTPSIILASGILAPGASVTASLEIHNEEIAGDQNGFGFSFFPTASTPTSPPVINGLPISELRPLGTPDTPFNGGAPFDTVTITDPNALPIETATITIKDTTGSLSDSVGLLAGAGLTHSGVGTYTLAPSLPTELSAAIDALTFTPTTPDAKLTLSVDNGSGTPASATVDLQTPPPMSPDGTIVVTDGPMIVTPQGNWTIVDGQVAFDGFADPTTSRVVAIGYANGQLWQENADKNWWYSNAPVEGAWTAGTPPPAIANPILAVSANNTVLTNFNQTIVDASQNTWSIVNGQVSTNGQVDPTTANVVKLAYENGQVWQENSANLWWAKSSPTDTWLPGPGTPVSPVNEPGLMSTTSALVDPTTMTAALGTSSPSFLQAEGASVAASDGSMMDNNFASGGMSPPDVPSVGGLGYTTMTAPSNGYGMMLPPSATPGMMLAMH